jgi:hypothetical protein
MKKFFVLGPPRSGTTLVSALLAHAGAEFGVDKVATWDTASGEFEHPLAIKTSVECARAERFRPLSRSLSCFFEKRASENMSALLKVADFVKYPPMSEKFPLIAKQLGYQPVCIVVVRSFLGFASSMLAKNNLNWDELERLYRQSLFTSLLLREQLGGCAIRYEELVGSECGDCLRILEKTSGLPGEALILAAGQLVRKRSEARSQLEIDKSVDELLKATGC